MAKTRAKGHAEAEVLSAEAGAYQEVRAAEVIAEGAQKRAETLNIEGSAEAELKTVLGSRRLYEFLNHKLGVIRALGSNPNFKIFGNQSDKTLSQLAAYRLMENDGKF